jgi:hypothetical protein
LVSWNLSDFSAVDPQLNDTIVSKVWRSLHDETGASAGRARLSVASEDRAGEGQNQKHPVRSYSVHKKHFAPRPVIALVLMLLEGSRPTADPPKDGFAVANR